MKYIQKFNENKNNDIPEEIWNKIDSLHNRLIYVAKKFVESKLSKIKNISDDDDIDIRTDCQFKVELPDNDTFYDFIIEYIKDNQKLYQVEYHYPYLIFKDENFKYKAPLNIYAGYTGDKFNDQSFMKYSIWINKYDVYISK